jgi:signal transduction histidine kinase
VHAEVSALAPGPRAAVWYICAEALANAAKHADARRVTISIEPGEHGVILVTIRDDGRGGAAMDAGTGLRGIRHRAEAQLGGLEVLSPPEGGTVVRAWLPDGPPITNARDVK